MLKLCFNSKQHVKLNRQETMNKLVKELSLDEMSQILGGKETKTIIRPDGSVLIITTEIKDDGTVVITRQEP